MSILDTIKSGIGKIKEHFITGSGFLSSEAPITKIIQGKPVNEILSSLWNSTKKSLTFPTREDFTKLTDATTSEEERLKIKDKMLNSAMIFNVGSLEKQVAPIIKTTAQNTIEGIKQIPALQKLLNALKEAKPARKELGKIYTAERATRASEVSKVFEQGKGEKGFFEALGKLKGELAPEGKAPKFEGLRGENKLMQTDVDELFKGIQQHPILDIYEKISASSGLKDLFEGIIPAKSKISLLEEVYGSDIVKEILNKRSTIKKIGDIAVDVLNIPRSLLTSFDMSAPLRQGIVLTVTKPKQAIPAFGEMFKYFFSPKAFNGWLDNIKISPEYSLIKKSKLYVGDPNKISGGLSAREESFMSNIAEKIPIIGQIVKASGRAYVGYLNKLRVDVFNNLSKKLIKDGLDIKTDEKVFKDLASFVNNATGRGSLGKLEQSGALLNNIFFSPRLIAARFNMLNPVWYAQKSPQVRREAIKTMAQFIGFGSTILAIAKAGGADVEIDPRSTDFGKIKVGNTRWDIWGGYQQWIRTFTQMVTGQRKTAKGDIIDLSAKKFPYETRLDIGAKFGIGKLAPVPSLVIDLMRGQKMFGEELKFDEEALSNMIPLYLNDMKEAIDDLGPEAIFTVGSPAFFGVGTQTYKSKEKGLSDIWK